MLRQRLVMAAAAVLALALAARAGSGEIECLRERPGPYFLDYGPQAEGAAAGEEGRYVLDRTLTASPQRPRQGEESSVHLDTEADLTALRIMTGSAFTPYLGAGLGPAEAETAPGSPEPDPVEAERTPPYRLGAGVGCDLGGSARLDLGYRYSTSTLPEFAEPSAVDTTSPEDRHRISIDIKLPF